MNAPTKQILERIALQRLEASADDEEKWSFLFRTDGSVGFLYCPWSEMEDLEFDGDLEGLDLAWDPGRRLLIAQGAELSDLELNQWRRAQCVKMADGSDWSRPAWIVPLMIDQRAAGYALFLCHVDENSPPVLDGVFDTFDEAKAALIKEGAVGT